MLSTRVHSDEPAPAPLPVSRRPWWLVPAFVTLMLIPQPVALAAVVGMIGARIAWTGARRLRARSPAGLAEVGGTSGAVMLGSEPSGRPVVLGDLELSAHGLILGASGAGKTTTLLTILTEQIRRGRPVVAIDLKGSPAFAEQLERAAAAAGTRLRVWSLDGSERWNPLAHGNATELKDKLIATERFTEPHYQRAAERYLQLALQVLGETHPDREPTISAVLALMDPKRLGALVRRLPDERARHVREYLAGLTGDQLSAIRGSRVAARDHQRVPRGRVSRLRP